MRALALGLLVAAGAAAAQDVKDALRVGDLICEFDDGYRRSLLADLVGGARSADLLLVYEAVQPDSAQVLSTRTPGRRAVAVRSTAQSIHFIEHVGASVRVTTLTGCERVKRRKGEPTCVRYAAQHAWHFDLLATADPEGALSRQPSGAAKGRCEPWAVD